MISHAYQKLWLAVRCIWWNREEKTIIKNFNFCFCLFLLDWGEPSHFEVLCVPWADNETIELQRRQMSVNSSSQSLHRRLLHCGMGGNGSLVLLTISSFSRKSVKISVEASTNLWWWLQAQSPWRFSHFLLWFEELASNRTWDDHCRLSRQPKKKKKICSRNPGFSLPCSPWKSLSFPTDLSQVSYWFPPSPPPENCAIYIVSESANVLFCFVNFHFLKL